MLQAALELVSKNGYAALNIKAVAGELGCSTAPVSYTHLDVYKRQVHGRGCAGGVRDLRQI